MPRIYYPWPSTSPPAPSPHTLVFRIGRIRWWDFCHENGSVRHYSFRTSSASDFKEHNDKTIRRIIDLGDVAGLYNPKTKVYVEFTGTDGDETDVSPIKDLSEEDVIWETVYAGDDGPLWTYSFRMLFSAAQADTPSIPSLLHDDIKNGYYLPTWRESFLHSWKFFWCMAPKVPQETPDHKKKDD
ncbi:hypothetical protein TWF970_000693 [Orbilia oligospora]|uniref:Uncharacterized protein n=1 Tax=Orbilia oligospora TaxID=2813651 RepID=A0A7C8RKL3_ORBOL|nr:hypothetical protein TWF970_000693 [Orbilia oligospora]